MSQRGAAAKIILPGLPPPLPQKGEWVTGCKAKVPSGVNVSKIHSEISHFHSGTYVFQKFT